MFNRQEPLVAMWSTTVCLKCLSGTKEQEVGWIDGSTKHAILKWETAKRFLLTMTTDILGPTYFYPHHNLSVNSTKQQQHILSLTLEDFVVPFRWTWCRLNLRWMLMTPGIWLLYSQYAYTARLPGLGPSCTLRDQNQNLCSTTVSGDPLCTEVLNINCCQKTALKCHMVFFPSIFVYVHVPTPAP